MAVSACHANLLKGDELVPDRPVVPLAVEGVAVHRLDVGVAENRPHQFR